jgi:hypothetical protein
VHPKYVIGQTVLWIVPIDFMGGIREYQILFMASAFKKVTVHTKYVIPSPMLTGELPLSLLVRR